MRVAWKASFKKDDSQWDGLSHHIEELVKDPHPSRYALVRLEVVEVKDMVQEGEKQPKVAVRHVELVTDPAEVLRIGSHMQKLYAQRTGRDDSQPSLFDEDRERDADEGEEIMAARAEAAEEAGLLSDTLEAGQAEADRAEEDAIRNNEPWPGDVEFTSPEEAPTGNVADEAESSPVKRSARRPRR